MTGDVGLLEQGIIDLHVSDIMTADGTVQSSRFKGTVHITVPDGTNIRLLNVLFIPGLTHNLISVKAAMEPVPISSFRRVTVESLVQEGSKTPPCASRTFLPLLPQRNCGTNEWGMPASRSYGSWVYPTN